VSAARQRWGHVAQAVTATVITIAVVSVAGELEMRYHERHRTAVPGTMPLMWYRHARLGQALVRNYSYFGWNHINQFGFRGAPTTVTVPPGTLRIMVVGGSTTFDTFVSADSMTWPARLQADLQALLPRRRIEVINAGVPGYAVRDETYRLQSELARFKPDLLVLFDGNNDLFYSLGPGRDSVPSAWPNTPDEAPVQTPWGRWLERHSLLYGKLVGRFEALRFAGRRARPASPAAQVSADSAVVERASDRFEKDVTAFVAIASAYGLHVVLVTPLSVTPPDLARPQDSLIAWEWRVAVPFARPEVVLRTFAGYRAVLQGVAARWNVPLIRADEFGIWDARLFSPGDPLHFDDAGAACMGMHMAAAILASGAVPGLGSGGGRAPERTPPAGTRASGC